MALRDGKGNERFPNLSDVNFWQRLKQFLGVTFDLTTGELGVSPIGFEDVQVTSAQILALNATPITILTAPGADKANIFMGAMLFYDFNAAAYGGIAAGEDLAINYIDGSGLQVGSAEATGFLDAVVDETRWVNPYAAASLISDIDVVANAVLVIQLLVGEIITGDSPLFVRTYFRTVPTVLT